MKDMRTVAMSAPVAPLVALAILAMSGSLEPLVAQSIPVSPIVGLNTLNWSASAGFGSTAPGWYKEVGLVDPDVVHLQGAVKQTSASGSDANLIGTLPPAASPNRVVYAIVHTFNGTYADIAISPNGQIVLIDPRRPAVKDYSFVSLEGISYEQFLPVGNPITPNTYWSANAGYGSSAPAWYEDGSFNVHLQGAVSQTFSSASNLLGTIVSGGAPQNRIIRTIVHTFDGTYADVAINPNGQISLDDTISLGDPRPPAVKDHSFVSLEGITYGRGLGGVINPISVNATNWSLSRVELRRTWMVQRRVRHCASCRRRQADRHGRLESEPARHPAPCGQAESCCLHDCGDLQRNVRRYRHQPQRADRPDRSEAAGHQGLLVRLTGVHHLPAVRVELLS